MTPAVHHPLCEILEFEIGNGFNKEFSEYYSRTRSAVNNPAGTGTESDLRNRRGIPIEWARFYLDMRIVKSEPEPWPQPRPGGLISTEMKRPTAAVFSRYRNACQSLARMYTDIPGRRNESNQAYELPV